MQAPQKTLALLIDGDNVPLRRYTKQIVQFCKTYGTLSTKNAYGDWKKLPLSTHRQFVAALGVTCVQQDRISKNATDKRIKRDVNEMVAQGTVDIYFLVSDDHHFAPDCEQIQRSGKQVFCIGSKNRAKTLRKFCNEIFIYSEILKKQRNR